MENIEETLKNYRLRKRRQEKIKHIKDSIKGFLMFGIEDSSEKRDDTTLILNDSEKGVPSTNPLSSIVDAEIHDVSDDILSSEEEVLNNNSKVEFHDKESLFLKYTLRIVYLAFWITLYTIAIELQFGIVFLMFSALVGIYLNTRTGPKKDNEISAYSVFNRNCESIDGTLKAEQFEREIGIR